jgi:hypothetical protein
MDQQVSTRRTYICTNKDIGWQLRAELTLKDSGITVGALAPRIVKPCDPSVTLSLDRPIVTEGDVIKPRVVYRGGVEGKSKIRWSRDNGTDTWDIVSESLDYHTSVGDVDCALRMSYTPVRIDGDTGSTATLTIGPVESQRPRVKNVVVSQNDRGALVVEAPYRGGLEGFSFIIWRVYEEDQPEPRKLGKTVDKELMPSPDLLGKMVDCIYVPVRVDGLAGVPTLSQNRIKVRALPTVTSAEILVKGGELKLDSLMHCRAAVSKGATPVYQWLRGDGIAWEEITNATGVELTATVTELGFHIRCTVIAVSSKGWRSAPFHVSTSSTVHSRKKTLTILYPGETPDSAYSDVAPSSVRTGIILRTNLPSDRAKGAIVQWQRETKGEWTDVCVKESYIVTADDVGKRVRVTGKSKTATPPTPTIELTPSVLAHSRAAIRATTFAFKAVNKLGAGSWTIKGNIQGVVMKSNTGTVRTARWGTVHCECIAGTTNEMFMLTDEASQFQLIPNVSDDHRLENLLGHENVRDFVVTTLRGFIDIHGTAKPHT